MFSVVPLHGPDRWCASCRPHSVVHCSGVFKFKGLLNHIMAGWINQREKSSMIAAGQVVAGGAISGRKSKYKIN